MSRSPLLAPWALPLWGLLLLALLVWLVPRQTGKLAEQALPGVLAELSRSLQVQATLEGYARGWLRSEARLKISHAALREPIPLTVALRHGPWLGEGGWGWAAARIPWPEQGGVQAFPPGERLELRLKTDLWGRSRACFWRLKGKVEDKLGEFGIGHEPLRLVGETRLPGVTLITRSGEVRLAELDLRLRLHKQGGQLVGMVGVDARRAALGRGEQAWLIEQPWLDLAMGEPSRLDLRWAGVRGGQSFGRLEATLRWQALDWAALRASLDRRALRLSDPARLRRQLDRLGLALGEGELMLERLALEQARGRLELEGFLRGREAPTGLRRLHLDLRLGVERPVAAQLLRASRWVQDEAGAERLLGVLLEQHILVEDEAMLRGALTLWDGALTLSGRPMVLEEVLGAPLNSNGLD